MNRLFSISLFLFITGCATLPHSDPKDPWEAYNRKVYQVNDALDKAILKPVAQGYKKIIPSVLRDGVHHFFNNLNDVTVLVNELLEGKISHAKITLGRVLLNSTIGIGGVFDIGQEIGLEKYHEDLGQTLGRWGIKSGPYFVIPFLGPSSLRDTFGLIGDYPFTYNYYFPGVATRNSLFILETMDNRVQLLQATNILAEAALDPYIFMRDAYLQQRAHLIRDGQDLPFEEESSFEEPQ